MTALKPCPFCGGRPDAEAFRDRTGNPQYHFVVCRACGQETVGIQSTAEDSAKQWNTRAPLASDEELRALQKAAGYRYWRAREAVEWVPDGCPASMVSDSQIHAATLSALERRLRGVE